MSFHSFVLLSPSAFVISTVITHLDPLSETIEELTNPADLSWTHHLHLYAFPPFSAITLPANPTEPFPPPHTPIHVTTLDLPRFRVSLLDAIPPPALSIRTDPPPRHTFPTHPLNAPMTFAAHPDSGVMIMEVYCRMPGQPDPHYIICLLKSTLLQYLPAPTSPLLFAAFPRPAPVVPWSILASQVRMFGPDLDSSSWVCYVYQNRYITTQDDHNFITQLRLYDFDPLRVRKEICDRNNGLNTAYSSRSFGHTERYPIEGERDGIFLITEETVLPANAPLMDEVRTGSRLPYMFVEKRSDADVALIDGERIVAITKEMDASGDNVSAEMEIMEF